MALCDLDVTKLHKISDQHGIKRRTTSAQEILTDHSIDVVSICSYDDQHTGQAITGLEHGKNLMVEKPLCLFPEDSERIVKAWEDSKVALTSNLILRASPGFVKLKEMIDDGAKVKLTVRFRGREAIHTQLGLTVLKRVADELKDDVKLESSPAMEGRSLSMTLVPNTKK